MIDYGSEKKSMVKLGYGEYEPKASILRSV